MKQKHLTAGGIGVLIVIAVLFLLFRKTNEPPTKSPENMPAIE